MRHIYIIGSLRDPHVQALAETLRQHGHEVFDEWFSAGPRADDSWQDHQQFKGVPFRDALRGPAAENIFAFDIKWLKWADTVVMVGQGKSRGIELGWAIANGAQGFVLLPEEPERWDVMLRFATDVVYTTSALIDAMKENE